MFVRTQGHPLDPSFSSSPGHLSSPSHDPNFVSRDGLAPAMALAQPAGPIDPSRTPLTLTAQGRVNAHLKVPALVVGMVASADSSEGMGLLVHREGRLVTWIRAPSTVATFLQSLTLGHVRPNASLGMVISRGLV